MTRAETILWQMEKMFYLGMGCGEDEANAKADEKINSLPELMEQDAWVEREEAKHS